MDSSSKLDLSGVISWFESIRSKLLSNLKGWPDYVVDALIFGVLGLFFGFMFRLSGRYLIGLLIFSAIVLWVGQYLQFIVINQEQVNSVFAIDPSCTVESVFADIGHWIKNNVVAFISLIFFFMIGWKLGK